MKEGRDGNHCKKTKVVGGHFSIQSVATLMIPVLMKSVLAVDKFNVEIYYLNFIIMNNNNICEKQMFAS